MTRRSPSFPRVCGWAVLAGSVLGFIIGWNIPEKTAT